MQFRRSIWITLAWSNASTVALFLVSLVVARILTPQEIGTFSMSVVVVNLLGVLRDLGGGPYLVRKADLSQEDVGAVLGLTLSTSWILATLIWFGRHAIAAFYGEPQIADVLQVLVLGFLMVPISAVLMSVLTRNLNAGRLALVSLGGTVAYAVTLLTLAWSGFGARAPAWANSANLLAGILVCLLLMPKDFRLRPRWSGWGPPIRFSGGVVVVNLSNVAYQSVPDVFIGRSLNAHDVGLFSRANGVVSLFQQVIGPTLTFNALPIIARTFHERASALAPMMLRSMELLTVLAWPVYAWIAVFPSEIIGVLYGPTWIEAAVLVPWLCLAAACRTPFLIMGPALQAVDRTYSAALAALAGLGSRVVVLALFGVHDLHRFVILLCVADLVSLAPWIHASRKYLGLGMGQSIKGLRRSLIVGGSCLLVALLVRSLLRGHDTGAFLAVLISGSCIGLAWAFSLWLTGHPFADEIRKGYSKALKLRG